MNNFTIKDGQFWLNDSPQLIQAGEFHYYRTPAEQWRHRLGLLKDAGFNAVASYIPWIWHQLEEGVTDVDGHSHPMRNLAAFLDLAAEMGFWIIARPGPYIMAETINEGIPPWVFNNYPKAAFISQDGKVQNVASYLHSDFLACVKGWYKAIFEVLTPRQVTHGGKIIMIQLDNEMGMIQWVRNIMDVNPDTIARFAHFLIHTDRIIRYPGHFSDTLDGFLQNQILNPEQAYGERVVEDYRYFYREYLREYAEWLWQEAKLNGMDVLPVINIHGFANGGKTFPIGLSQLIDVMRIDGMVSATDVYPGIIGEGSFHQLLMVNEMTKALHNKQQPLFSIEFQSGGNHDFSNSQSSFYDLHSRLCISSGMRGLNHYLFFGGKNDPVLSPTKRHDWGPPVRVDGSLRHHYHRYPKLSKALSSYGEALITAKPQTVTAVGFMLDQYMTEVNNQFSQESTKRITRQRETIQFDMIARGLSITHRPFFAIDIDTEALEAEKLPLCWVMMEKQCWAKTQQKLLDYVKQGGKLILAGRMCDEDFDHVPCTILKDGLGIDQIETCAPYEYQDIQVFDYKDVPVRFVEKYTSSFDEIIARDGGDCAIGFVKTVGKGSVMMLGAAMYIDTMVEVDILDRMAARMGCSRLFTMDNWVDVRISCGKKGSFLFINNYQDDPVETHIDYQSQPLFGGNAVALAARQGLILPIDWQVSPDILIHYCTAEINQVEDFGDVVRIQTTQPKVLAELTLSGYTCENCVFVEENHGKVRVRLEADCGEIVLKKNP